MEILLAESSGFCVGVRLAVRKAEEAVAGGRAVHSLGPIIHNPQEVARLAEMGVRVAEGPAEVSGGTVVIRAHGAPPSTYGALAAQGIQVVDATCPFVSSLQRKAAALADAGYEVVIVGDPAHPEVTGVVGWTGGRARVLACQEDVDALPPLDRVGVVAQTTQRQERVEAIVSRLRAKANEVRVEHTICRATTERQEAARELAGRVEVMIVVGGAASSNTQKLVSICRDAGAVTYHVETAGDLRAEWFRGVARAGITAGASTPDWIVKEVIGRMEDMAREEQVAEAEAPTPAEAPAQGAGPSQQDLEDIMKTPRRGQVVEGVVVQVTPNHLLVDIGYKSEGIVPLKEMGLWPGQSPEEVFSNGQKILVSVLGMDEAEGELKLSHRRARDRGVSKHLEKAFKEGEILEGTVREAVKGGLIVDVGGRAFMPASHVDLTYVPDLNEYVGRKVRVRIIEMDRGRKVIVSRKAVLEEERKTAMEEALAALQEGEVRRGTVKNVTNYGAFIDLGGIDGLLHVSEMSWRRVNHPSEVLKAGDEVDVKVIRVDRENGKVALSLKQVRRDPWETVEADYAPGTWVSGRVVRIAPFGAFIELAEGLEGLAHISQLAPHHVADPREVVQEGETVQVRVLRVSPAERRISLSLVPEERREPREPREGQPRRRQPRERAARPAAEPAPAQGGGMTLGEMYGDLLQETKTRLNGKRS